MFTFYFVIQFFQKLFDEETLRRWVFFNGLDIYQKTKPLSNSLSLVLNLLFYIFQAICLFHLVVNSLPGLMIVSYLSVSILQQRLIWFSVCFFLTSAKWLEKENRASYHIYWNWSSSRTSRSTSIPVVSGMCFCPHLTPLLLSGDQEDWRTMFITRKERTSPHRSGLRQRQEHPST